MIEDAVERRPGAADEFRDLGHRVLTTVAELAGVLDVVLDAEVATIVNSIAHGLLIERVDPPLKTVPREGEEIRAQYAFSNSLARKVVTCRLTTLTRASRTGASSRSAAISAGTRGARWCG